jgi:hypothetical protein
MPAASWPGGFNCYPKRISACSIPADSLVKADGRTLIMKDDPLCTRLPPVQLLLFFFVEHKITIRWQSLLRRLSTGCPHSLTLFIRRDLDLVALLLLETYYSGASGRSNEAEFKRFQQRTRKVSSIQSQTSCPYPAQLTGYLHMLTV